MDDTFVLLEIYAALESVTFHHFVFLIEQEIFAYRRNLPMVAFHQYLSKIL